MRIFKPALLAVCLAALAAPAAHAALVLQSEASGYTLDLAGTKTAAVNFYLAQTDGTTTLSSGGGLNSAGFMVTALTPAGPTLTSITANPAFGTATPNTTAGTLYEERPDVTSGVPVDAGGRVFLGTFSYRVTGGLAAPATGFAVADRPETDGFYTAGGTLLDAQITPGTFTVTVPEPATLGVAVVAAILGLRRQRSAAE